MNNLDKEKNDIGRYDFGLRLSIVKIKCCAQYRVE